MIFLDSYDNLQLPMGVTKGSPPPKILQQIKLEEPQGLGFARTSRASQFSPLSQTFTLNP